MFRNYLAAALRNLVRNRLYSGISIFGLAIGLCAAILVGLVIRNQLSYDRFIPGYERTYLSVSVLTPQGRAPDYNVMTHSGVAAILEQKFAEVEATARLVDETVLLRRGEITAKEKMYWSDQDVFDVLPLPAFAGNLQTALRRPDGIVLTRSIARKYFGRDDPIGETIQLARTHLMTVSAVIEDLPLNGTRLESGVFASGLASHSPLTIMDNDPVSIPNGSDFSISVRTYLRLAPHASIDRLQKAMPALIDSLWPRRPPGLGASMELIRIDKVQMLPGLNPGIHGRLAVTGVVGVLILFIACINFVNLSTALSARRALEVGIRKAAGASRGDLILQFLGESLIHVLLAACIAVAGAELLLPRVNSFLDAGAVFDYWQDPALIAWIAVGALVLGVLAGGYPAFVLSSFRPAGVLRRSIAQSGGAPATRSLLVTLQFAILIGLMIAAGVVNEQRLYATRDALRVDTDQMLIIRSPCNAAFKAELQALPGVRGAYCGGEPLLTEAMFANIRLKDGNALSITVIPVEAGVLDLYGLTPVAGRFFLAERSGESSLQGASAAATIRYVINETAVQRLGFASPEAAVGQMLALTGPSDAGEIIGVVGDFSLSSVVQGIKPAVYVVTPRWFDLINVKLTGRQIPETLAAVDRLWAMTGAGEPIARFFLNDHIQDLYMAVRREAQALGVFSCIAILLACLGLLGLAASAVTQRTQEIGIRKAMGADTGDIVRLLLWHFTRPVLWANLVAWPMAYYVMNRWLQGFAYRIDLRPWIFLAAGAAALLISLLTVSAHALLVARAKPVAALRYE